MVSDTRRRRDEAEHAFEESVSVDWEIRNPYAEARDLYYR